MDWLRQGRQDLEALRKDVLEFHTSQAEIKKLGAELAADRQAIQEFNERMNAISTRAPEIEAKVEAVLDMMSIVEHASQKATGLQELLSTLDGQVARLESRASFVEGIETRLNTLNTLSTEIDRRLEQQLERRGDFDMLNTASDGVVAQIADAHHKLEAVHALQARFMPLLDQAKALKSTSMPRAPGWKKSSQTTRWSPNTRNASPTWCRRVAPSAPSCPTAGTTCWRSRMSSVVRNN